jgi:predicted NBD/HSP70 family sugar kinase
MSHFVGLDVSQKMTAICVLDKDGRRIWRGQCPSVPEQIRENLKRGLRDRLTKEAARSKIVTLFPDEAPLRRELYVKHCEFFRLG